MMVRMINHLTGGPMWVHESRVEEYKAAGHRPAADPGELLMDEEPEELLTDEEPEELLTDEEPEELLTDEEPTEKKPSRAKRKK